MARVGAIAHGYPLADTFGRNQFAGRRRISRPLALAIGLSVFLHVGAIYCANKLKGSSESATWSQPSVFHVILESGAQPKQASRLPEALSVSAVPSTSEIVGRPERVLQAPPNTLPDLGEKTDDDYYLSSALEVRPRLRSEVDPTYPAEAGTVQGKVKIKILISENGLVDEVIVLSAVPEGLFEKAAIEAFRRAVFSPGKLLGQPVKSQVSLEVEFQSYNRGAGVSQ
jgi:protein TonB